MGRVQQLAVALEKPYYVAGETVRGTVYLELGAAIPVDGMYIKVKGKEKVEWKDEWEESVREEVDGVSRVVGSENREEEYDYKESFFKMRIDLVPDGAQLLPGKSAFPFQFDIPTHGKKGSPLPASFELKEKKHGNHWWGARGKIKGLKVKVEYSVKAVIDLEDSKDMEAKKNFVVYAIPPESLQIPYDEKTANVMFLCCINKGSLHMRASLEKNVYYEGERAKAVLEVSNNSTMEVTATVEFNTNVHLRADRKSISRNTERNLGRFDTVMPGESRTVYMEFDIPDTLPVTAGKGVHCENVLDIVSEISWAPDIELHFPVHVLERPIPPAQWIEHIGPVNAYPIAGSCTVVDMPVKPGYE